MSKDKKKTSTLENLMKQKKVQKPSVEKISNHVDIFTSCVYVYL